MTTSLQRRPGVQGQRGRSPVSPTPQYDAYGPQLGYLSESIHRLLTERECAIFDRGLADYHRRRNISSFVECLSFVLNTNQKRQLLLPIRDSYVKPSDLVKFNQLVQDHGLATSLRRKKKQEEKAKAGSGVRRLEVKRDSNGEWGFSIRGGAEHGVGVFISWVEPGSGAHKSGLQVGDQILKANDTSFESISHYEAVTMLKSTKRISLWVLSRGRVPSSRMTHKVYRWMSPEGRSVSPPPDPFDLQDQTGIGERGVMNEADERKVTVVVEDSQELGISIRGGAEHGLGIYVSVVEEGSVADNYGIKPGDQVLEVNEVSFLNIIHNDAANALRAQRCMVIKVKDVGKIPHSRITTYGQTEWKSPSSKSSSRPSTSSPVFKTGMGTQVMHGKQQTGSIQGRGLMKDVARSVLNTEEFTTFDYYINQYEQHGLSVEDLVAPLLDLLNTPEKLQLLSEVRVVIKAHDLQQFNELTVHKEITARKSFHSQKGTVTPDGSSKPTSSIALNRTPDPIHLHNESDTFILSPPNGEIQQYNDADSEDGGRDRVPQRLSPERPTFNVPPPPPAVTSTPDGNSSPDAQAALIDTLKERRQWMRSGTKEQSMDDTWDGQWNESSLQQPPLMREGGHDETDGAVDISAIEAKVRSETEAKLRREFEEQQQKLLEEQQQRLEEEKQENQRTLRREREQLRREMEEQEQRVKTELEEQLKTEAEERIRRELEEKEREMNEEFAKRSASQSLEQAELSEEQIREIEERTRMELEEKIYKEAEENLRHEFEAKMEEEKAKIQTEVNKSKSPGGGGPGKEAENQLRRELEQKFKREYEEKMRRERDKIKKQQEEDKKRKEAEERAKREEEVARLEAEEQARIENEERIRREAEEATRAEYEARLQKETEERAKLAEEVKVRKAADERREAKDKAKKSKHSHKKQKPAEESDEDVPDSGPMHTGPATEEEEKMLEAQRSRREAEDREREREERAREEEEQRAAKAAQRKQDEERQKKLELQRKREENIRRREEERKQKEAELRHRLTEQKKTDSPLTKPKRVKQKNADSPVTKPKVQSTRQNAPTQQKTKQQIVEEERRKAEEKLQKRIKRAQEKKAAEQAAATAAAATITPPSSPPEDEEEGLSYGGYENLHGKILNITVTKICKKLGIAIDGGANTKQKAVIMREIAPEGCAARTAPHLAIGQQLLAVAGQSLYGLKHKDVVLAIKGAFEGPLQKTLELVVLDPQ